MKLQALWLAVSLAAFSTGCVALQEQTIDTQNRARAWVAWHAGRNRACRPHRGLFGPGRHYACGWRTGYYDACCGRCAHAPVLPPAKYWGVMYTNGLGHASIHAWFDGHREGVMAAEMDGMVGVNTIPAQVMLPGRAIPAEMILPTDGESIPAGTQIEGIIPPEPPADLGQSAPSSRTRATTAASATIASKPSSKTTTK